MRFYVMLISDDLINVCIIVIMRQQLILWIYFTRQLFIYMWFIFSDYKYKFIEKIKRNAKAKYKNNLYKNKPTPIFH